MPIIIPGNRLASTGHTISQSIRFNDDDSPYMSRTFGTATNAKKWTLSAWVKVHGITDGATGGVRLFDVGGSAGSEDLISIGSGYAGYSNIYFWSRTSSSYNWRLQTTAEYRDPSAWMHLTFVFDSDNTISTDRMKMYTNGIRVTDFQQESYPSSGAASRINTAVEHRIGNTVYSSSNYSNGYAAEIVFIDGQALTCDSFGEFNSSGIWIPKDISDLTFGNNGYHIDGRDASDLGDDESGNGNDFATSGLAAHDQVLDSPTNNFATINPLDWSIRNAANSVPLSEGNLKFTGSDSTGVYGTYYTTIQVPSTGSWYFELVPTAIGSAEKQSQYIYVGSVGFLANGNTNAGAYGSAWSAGDIIGVAVNSTGVWFSINGTYQNSGNPATGSNPAGTTSLPGAILIGDGSATTNSSSTGVLNFGQDGTFAGNKTAQGNKDSSGIGNFYYSPPSGFKALCTKNLRS